MLDTIRSFFSNHSNNQKAIFQELSVWKDQEMRNLAGQFPVVSLSFSTTTGENLRAFQNAFITQIAEVYQSFPELLNSPNLTTFEQKAYQVVCSWSNDGITALPDGPVRDAVLNTAATAIRDLCRFLHRHYGRKVIVLLDEYDTPMEEAWIHGYWDQIVPFVRRMMNASFKANPSLSRALITGITRICKESIFSDLNNLQVATVSSNFFTASFGFTETEVIFALDEFGLSDKLAEVRNWYDGFTFGSRTDIYNPWSITKFLYERRFEAFWAETSDNALAGKAVAKADPSVKTAFESLLQGRSAVVPLTDALIFSDLDWDPASVWSLLLANGYIKLLAQHENGTGEVALTNKEMLITFEKLIKRWFGTSGNSYESFLQALRKHDIKYMNVFLKKITLSSFSYFDVGGETEPERFYHGFVLGLLVSLSADFIITSNRESGFGRYDIMLEPRDRTRDDAFIIEFKVREPDEEKSLEDTVHSALDQIDRRAYAADLINRNIPASKIHRYGIAFSGKNVLIGEKNQKLIQPLPQH